jgi:prostaglandin-H2 D-isomerase / glutathione transferase
MPKYVLNYFNGRGRAEISRLICAAADIPYTDSRIKDFSEWPAKKPEAPTGQMPYLEIDDLKLPQSMSIARYFAREAGLAGKTSLEQAQADAIVDVRNK